MAEQQHKDRPSISVEQLLRFKRSERPDAHFWEGFEHELRRRQLASVVSVPAWHVRLGRNLSIGLRRAVPLGAAAVAAVAGFMVLQHPQSVESTAQAPVAAAEPVNLPATLIEVAPPPVAPAVAARAEMQEPAFERATSGETRFVVHEFVASASPARTFVSVTSPNTFSAPAYDSSLQTVNTLTSGTSRYPSAREAAGSF